MISKIARNISAPESNVHHMHDACNYVIFFDPEYDDGAIGPGSSAGSAPRARRALPALLLALDSAQSPSGPQLAEEVADLAAWRVMSAPMAARTAYRA